MIKRFLVSAERFNLEAFKDDRTIKSYLTHHDITVIADNKVINVEIHPKDPEANRIIFETVIQIIHDNIYY